MSLMVHNKKHSNNPKARTEHLQASTPLFENYRREAKRLCMSKYARLDELSSIKGLPAAQTLRVYRVRQTIPQDLMLVSRGTVVVEIDAFLCWFFQVDPETLEPDDTDYEALRVEAIRQVKERRKHGKLGSPTNAAGELALAREEMRKMHPIMTFHEDGTVTREWNEE